VQYGLSLWRDIGVCGSGWLGQEHVGEHSGGGKDAHGNRLIQEKMERPLGRHSTSQMIEGAPAVYRRRIN
jgi:hypothetical protein